MRYFYSVMTYQIVVLSSPNPPGCKLCVLRDCQSKRVCFSLWLILVLLSSGSILLRKPRTVVAKPLIKLMLMHVISNYARDTSFFGIYVTVLWLSFIYVFSPCFQHRYTSLVSHFPFLLFLDSPPMLHASMSACVLPGDDYNDIHTIWNRRYTRENGFCVQPMRSLSTTVSDACLFPFQCQLFFNRLFILTLVYAFPTDAASNNGGLL